MLDPKFIFRPKNLASFDLYSSLSDCRREYNFSWLSVWWCLVFQWYGVRCPHPNCSQSTKYLRCPPSNFMFSPQPNCSLHQESMCGAHPPECGSLLLPHSALSWILSKVENLANSSLQGEATDWLFCAFCMCSNPGMCKTSFCMLRLRLRLSVLSLNFLY